MNETKPLKLDDIIIDKPIIESYDHKVKILQLVYDRRKIDLGGYVASDSKPGLFYTVKTEYEPGSKNIIYGECTCESYEYYGSPCKHILRLRNVFLKNNQSKK